MLFRTLTAACLGAIILWSTTAAAEVLVPNLPTRSVPGDEAQSEARRAYKKATEALQAGKNDRALESAKLAYAMLPNASTASLYCIVLGEIGRAREAFERCLIALSLEPTRDEHAVIQDYLARFGREIGLGWADIHLEPAGARVTLGTASFDGSRPVGLSAGDHRVVVESAGYKTRELPVAVSAGLGVPVFVALSAEAASGGGGPPDPPIGPTTPPQKGPVGGVTPSQIGGISMIVAGAVLGLGGGLGGLVWQLDLNDAQEQAARDYEAAANGSAEEAAAATRHANASSDLDDAKLVTGLCIGIGAATAIGGVLLYALAGEDADDGTVRVVPGPGPGAGLSLTARF